MIDVVVQTANRKISVQLQIPSAKFQLEGTRHSRLLLVGLDVEIDDGPVQPVVKEILEVLENHSQERTLEQFVDAPVRQFLEEVVDVFDEPCHQLQEGTLEVIQPIPAECISGDEAPELEQLVQRITRAERRERHHLTDSS